jgi:polynucleotide 5'-hydroxyl-kinase GRC3/NOL9
MMKRNVEKGKTLLVDGPASVTFLSGEVEVLGGSLAAGEKIVIRDGKRLPFEVNEKAMFELKLGENASVEEVEGTTIPSSWENTSKEAAAHGKPVTVMVMGGVDSGKTSFCAYLANRALKENLKAAVIDGDLGQSDIGPPSTVGFSYVTKPIKDLFEMEVESACFIGVTTPSLAVSKVIEELTTLKNRVLKTDVEFLIVNTEGWVEGEDAVKYKVQLAEKATPDMVVGIQRADELTPILTVLKKTMRTIAIDSPLAIRKRNREKRKILRALGYKKYLKNAKVQLFHLNQVKIKDVFSESWENLTKEEIQEDALIALQDAQLNFLGIGILYGIDFERGLVKVYTTVSENVSTILFGKVKLNKKGREMD